MNNGIYSSAVKKKKKFKKQLKKKQTQDGILLTNSPQTNISELKRIFQHILHWRSKGSPWEKAQPRVSPIAWAQHWEQGRPKVLWEGAGHKASSAVRA